MAIKKFCQKIILIIITISILLSFIATPISNAALKLKEGEFYYSGTTKGTYVVSQGIFEWLIDCLGKIADWILGLITMGVRMVFVGWTALIEKLLTWAIESTSGINNNGGLVVDSTDVTSIGDSSGNITVQAIVYNQVPLFDINIFKLEADKTVTGTGQKLKCKTCGRPVDECCNVTGTEGNYTYTCNPVDNSSTSCECNGCESCEMYIANWNTEKPLVIKIRETVSMWYSIIRLLSMIVMLIVLIAIGLKMALSTIASEKAVYKRMFVDWVVGIIILFAIHYLILFVITMNETLVNTVKEAANSVNKTQIQYVTAGKEGSDEDTQEVSNEEIEISVYEEIRSRAYDAKLTVGLSGMIMYITLVYFAIRYSIVYLKRYLTVIVLILMAPPLGVAFALQKALNGKAPSFKTWMNEFVMTVIIQIVHALIYSVFISTALVLSLESVPGMIVALIFMNFALKAEKMFRQIFKIGDGDSLAGSAADAGDAEKIQSNIKSLAGMAMSAKPIAGAMMNTPLAKGIKSAGKIALTGGAVAGNAIVGAYRKKHQDSNEQTEETNNENDSKQSENNKDTENEKDTSNENDTDGMSDEDKALWNEGEGSLRQKASDAAEVLQNKDATKEEKMQANEQINNYVRYKQLQKSNKAKKKKEKSSNVEPSSAQIFGAHVKKAVNITNHFQVNNAPSGSFASVAGSLYRTTFGTKHYDKKTGKMVYDGNGYFSQFNAQNLLGLSKEDKQFLKTEAMKPLKGVLGAAEMFLGLGTMVAHPKIGAASFAIGAKNYNKGFRLPTGSREYKGTYGKARFPAATAQTVQQKLLQQAYFDIEKGEKFLDAQMIKSVKNNHPDLYNEIMNEIRNTGTYSGIKISGTIDYNDKVKKGFGGKTSIPKKFMKVSGIFNPEAYTDSISTLDRYAFVRAKKETETFEKESAGLLKGAYQQETEALVKKQNDKLENDLLLEKIGYEVDPATHMIRKKESTIEEDKFDETVDKDKAKKIEDSINTIMQDMYRVSGELDTSDKGIDKVLQILNSKLKSDKILDEDQNAENLFKNDDTTTNSDVAKDVLKEKMEIFNAQVSIDTSSNEEKSKIETMSKLIEENGFSKDEEEMLKQVIVEEGILQENDENKNDDNLENAKKIMDSVSAKLNNGSKANDKSEIDKKKLKALDAFLKGIGSIKAPEISTDHVSKSDIENAIGQEKVKDIKKSVKKSHNKIKKVLQFMEESEDGTLEELMNSTEEKVKNAKDGIEVNGTKLEFNETEAETLQLLFDKMKEEIAFNEYTKDVLDQKDGYKTLQAKRNYYDSQSNYLAAKRQLLMDADTIANKHKDFGVDSNDIKSLIEGASTSEIANKSINSLGKDDISKIVKNNKNILKAEVEKSRVDFDEFIENESNSRMIKNKVTNYLEKQLQGDMSTVNQRKRLAQNAKKKSILTGKIDIYSQLNDLL